MQSGAIRHTPNIAALYLARPAHGVGTFEAFVDSYLRYDAGAGHDLVVLFKGFAVDGRELAVYQHRLTGLTYRSVIVPDERFDLGAYLAAAAALPHEWVCCLNSYSEPLMNGWLGYLSRAADTDGVGVAGASGSFESASTDWQLVHEDAADRVPALLRPLARRLPWRVRLWLARRWPLPYPYRDFPPFPNPHLRTTGFVIRRRLLLELDTGPLADKWDALRLESGRNGLTRQLQRRGLRTVVVGRGGQVFEPPDWPDSQTFRRGIQANLLIGDNHTREFMTTSAANRAYLAKLAWGPGVTEGRPI